MGKLIALHGRAIFDQHDIAPDLEADAEKRGPWPAWVLFTWKVNEMVPEVFATKGRDITVKQDEPAVGWVTEEYKRARVMHPPLGETDKVIVATNDPTLYPVWDKAMQIVVSYGIHRH